MHAAFRFDNTFARELVGFYAPVQAAQVPQPAIVQLNHALAAELRLDAAWLNSPEGAAILAGNTVPAGAQPLAQVYAGHQFGGYSPQLGDGRALLLGEVIDSHGQRRDIALKGSGRTPFSRGGDGKAGLGPVLREYLMGEAMHALGIPTTRALAATTTGEQVRREGAPPGAVLARVAASHIRVGTFQFFAAQDQGEGQTQVQQLADYVIARHYPEAQDALALFQAVCERQAALLAQWMRVGFIHGVMNTDNMAVSGETIDYGPCAFMDTFDPATVFSSIDHQGRYAYANQPLIARWNLARLAETLLPLIDADSDRAVGRVTEVLEAFPARYQQHWLDGMRRKLGLASEQADDLALAQDFLAAMQGQSVDYTLALRDLAELAANPSDSALRTRFNDPAALDAWLPRWQARCAQEPVAAADRAAAMRRASPLYIPRNHLVEAALSAAVERGDYAPFEALLAVLQHPFDAQPGREAYAQPAPAAAAAQQGYRTFCGT